MDNTLQLPVLVFYCKCGKSIQMASDPEFCRGNRESREEFADAMLAGRKIETMTKEEFLKLPFLCIGVEDCPITIEEARKKQTEFDF